MVNNFVQLKVRASTKERLDNDIRILKEEFPDLKNLKISYDYMINRVLSRWENLK